MLLFSVHRAGWVYPLLLSKHLVDIHKKTGMNPMPLEFIPTFKLPLFSTASNNEANKSEMEY